MRDTTRRIFLKHATGIGALIAVGPGARLTAVAQDAKAAAAGSDFPAMSREAVREIVTVSHTNLDRVRELIARRPALANATWDWGFGDWESPLGAASHMGRRDIASFLLGAGARASIFSAAMLGQLDVVRAFVDANPGVQKTTGPHGISLIQHARAGGTQSAVVVRYLESIGDADPRPTVVALTDAERAAIGGRYRLRLPGDPAVEIDFQNGSGGITITGGTRRFLSHLGALQFTPGGIPSVRIAFQLDGARARTLTIADGDLSLVAERTD